MKRHKRIRCESALIRRKRELADWKLRLNTGGESENIYKLMLGKIRTAENDIQNLERKLS